MSISIFSSAGRMSEARLHSDRYEDPIPPCMGQIGAIRWPEAAPIGPFRPHFARLEFIDGDAK